MLRPYITKLVDARWTHPRIEARDLGRYIRPHDQMTRDCVPGRIPRLEHRINFADPVRMLSRPRAHARGRPPRYLSIRVHPVLPVGEADRKSTRLNSSHSQI